MNQLFIYILFYTKLLYIVHQFLCGELFFNEVGMHNINSFGVKLPKIA